MFDGFLKHAEALKSIMILPMEVSVPKHIIALIGTLLQTVKIMKSIANTTVNLGLAIANRLDAI